MVSKSKELTIKSTISYSTSPSMSEVSILTTFCLNSPIESKSSSLSKPKGNNSNSFSKLAIYSLELSVILEYTKAL